MYIVCRFYIKTIAFYMTGTSIDFDKYERSKDPSFVDAEERQ